MSDVHVLPEGYLPPNEPDPGVIALLKKWLRCAEWGERRALAIAGVMRNGFDASEWVHADDAHAMRLYAGVNLLRARLEGPLVAAAERGAA